MPYPPHLAQKHRVFGSSRRGKASFVNLSCLIQLQIILFSVAYFYYELRLTYDSLNNI